MKYVCDSNEAFQKALTDYDLSKSKNTDTSFKKPSAKTVRFESSSVEVSNFARKILDSSPSEAKRARGDSPFRQVVSWFYTYRNLRIIIFMVRIFRQGRNKAYRFTHAVVVSIQFRPGLINELYEFKD